MPSPQRLYEFYTNAELDSLFTQVKTDMTSGRFTSLSGAGKSSSREYMDLETTLNEINAEYRYRRRQQPPQKVEQVLHLGYYGNQ